MVIEGGSSNNEIQNQEINQSANEQVEQNQAEHQRSGEELEGNSTIDNEGERKQIEGKDDATESSEGESSQLDNEDSIENDTSQEQPTERESVSPEQQLDTQDTIDGVVSSTDEMCENNRENVDSLDLEDSIEDVVKKSQNEIQEGITDYYSDCSEIGKNPDMTPAEKVDAMQEKFESLGDGNRGDAQCIASEKYLNSEEPFSDNGRANVDYPDHQGFNMEEGKEPKAISRDNPMQESVDRYGASGGNFVAGMENGEPTSFDSRALPNVENPDSYHTYDVDNGRYCDAIDMVRNCDPNNMDETIDGINEMIDSINEEQGLDLDHIDLDDLKDMLAHYNDYQNNIANDIPEISSDDAPYGLSGEAAPWDTSSGERLSEGGANQEWLPLTVDDFEKMGIFKEK